MFFFLFLPTTDTYSVFLTLPPPPPPPPLSRLFACAGESSQELGPPPSVDEAANTLMTRLGFLLGDKVSEGPAGTQYSMEEPEARQVMVSLIHFEDVTERLFFFFLVWMSLKRSCDCRSDVAFKSHDVTLSEFMRHIWNCVRLIG